MNSRISPKLPRFARDAGRNDKRGGNREVDQVDFELAPFNREGGLGKVHQVFGAELNRIIEELNGALAA